LSTAQLLLLEKAASSLQLGEMVEGVGDGLIHILELSAKRIAHPREVVKEGDVLELKIVRTDPERERLGLSLRQAVAES
jgi:ribosomal protein S1